jgi:hypothetical protein
MSNVPDRDSGEIVLCAEALGGRAAIMAAQDETIPGERAAL